ncbi:PLP-dependent aminotransferase family protein [Paracoccus sp. IB05]|uniref:aminotransferase-like domain-containing protein n=1 Tax=Paracoccus sp. IB05 TaxID=2779367 RepID=UPI0018E72FB6|nr:PLP-dependent aminotransferase family protein [Paracoccus sp. IB05]MBJ2150266.1 PLP-dependent aminotransferase family protein [Paracoccus sp. IB05]
MWTPWITDGARLKYLGIVEALEADIRAARIGPGERLPPQRSIAEQLGVDLTTVTRAFNEARRRRLVAAQAGRGTFVRDDPAEFFPDEPAPVLDLSMNIPPQPEGVDFRKLIPQGLAAILNGPRGGLSLQYQESSGGMADRIAATQWLSRRHGALSHDRVLVTAGAQSALFALTDLLVPPGAHIAAGEMTYPGLKASAAQRGAMIDPIAMDAGGLIPDDFRRLCEARAPHALYVTPSIDNPTTATLPEARRIAVAEIARKYSVAIIEDDPYAPLHAEQLPSFLTLAPDLTWHLATLSKSVTPALRVAYVVAPDPARALRLASILRATVLMAPPLLASLATRWLREGVVDEIAAAIRTENRIRQTLAAEAFRGADFRADPEGHHLWLRLPPHWRATDFAEHADRAGVSIVPASAFATGEHASAHVRISLGVAPDRGVLEEGLQQLAALMQRPSGAVRAVV